MDWQPYITATGSWFRRMRWYGWQYREMTPQERHDFWKFSAWRDPMSDDDYWMKNRRDRLPRRP
jgi:hypothetical protein